MATTKNFKNATTGLLLATIIGNPVAAYSVEKLLSNSSTLPTIEDLKKIDGIGQSTAEKVLAVCELSARYIVGTELQAVNAPEDVLNRLAFLKYEQQEHLVAITLDAMNHVIKVHDLSKGLVNQTPVHPREAFRDAIVDNAVSVIFAHNHPSSSLDPSQEDISITRVLCASGKILQIPVIDHIIIGKSGFTSLCRRYPEIFEQAISA